MRDDLINQLLPPVEHDVAHWDLLYPARLLPGGARVTRFAPSPTGFVHIGGVYTAMISQSVAHGSSGTYFVRIEDTDRAREVADAVEQFDRAFAYFDVTSDEAPGQVPWGPYRQSERSQIYLTYVRELLRSGRAYPCFCTTDDLADIRAQQNAAKVGTGYHGQWARCRSLTDDAVAERVAAGAPAVIRFAAPDDVGARVVFADAVRGEIEQQDNVNDVVILKSDEYRMPTYHFAHAVDDHLMGVNLVIRGEEWISSVPVHLQLFAALGFDSPTYAHVAPLMKLDGSSKRKLSKRKDPEASVDYFMEKGYPAAAVRHYLRGLANSNLAELSAAEAADIPIALDRCSVSGALVDLAKLDDIATDVVAEMGLDDIADAVSVWADEFAPDLAAALRSEPDRLRGAFAIGRGTDRQRKDVGRWSQVRPVFGFLFDAVFEPVTNPADDRFGGVAPDVVRALATDLADAFVPEPDPTLWFEQVKSLSGRHGFALNKAQLKEDPDAYVGLLKDAAQVVRVLLAGSTRSPELDAIAAILGPDEVRRRLRAVI